jgi:Domain of unknown function (DUF4158)
VSQRPDFHLLQLISSQLTISPDAWENYSERAATRREHLLAIQSIFGFRTFSMNYYKPAVQYLETTAWQTDKGIVLIRELIESFRNQKILLPSINVIERICAEASGKFGKKGTSKQVIKAFQGRRANDGTTSK